MTVGGSTVAWIITILSIGGALHRVGNGGDYDFTGPFWLLLGLFVTAVTWAVYFAFR